MRIVRRARERALSVVRRGPRRVLMTQPTANLGNLLYEWMNAWTWQGRGEDVVCLVTPKTLPWLPVFGPALRPLLVREDELRLTDIRERGLHNEFGVHFDEDDLAAFAQGLLVPSGVLDTSDVPAEHLLTGREVLVNVRRGDYVSVEAHRQTYAFDLDEYLTAALERSIAVGGPVDRVHVVSDGIDWCASHLGWLDRYAARVTFATDPLPPRAHLAILAHAPRLVLANSTFSYWGGYLSAWRSGRPQDVVAPWFHARPDNGGAAWQLDPRWSIVRDIPSGWALPS